ncbi:porin [Polaromonas aquatica]|uniref:porin n=1 Tax=Polaromonas aquatica TaxID=332657 RepID=UPI003D6571BB
MKTKLFALSVLSAASCAAQAQSTVTLYGVADSYVEAASAGNGNVMRVSSGGVMGSRFGFRGSEDLGGGLKANFALEAGFLIDTGASTGTTTIPTSTVPTGGSYMFQRLATVGFSGGFGSVNIGRQYTPHFGTMAAFDPAGFAMSGALNYYAGPGVGINGGSLADATTRRDNSIQYTTPTWSGFKASLFYAMGESTGAGQPKSTGDTLNVAAGYSSSTLSAQVSYMTEKTVYLLGNTDKYTDVAVSYDFGFIKPSAIFVRRRGEMTGAPALDAYQIGASAPVGVGKLIATYGQLKNKTTANADSKAIGVRYDYPLSKRTTLYAGATRISNSANAGYTISGGGGSSAGLALSSIGQDPKSVYAGIAHVF